VFQNSTLAFSKGMIWKLNAENINTEVGEFI
jgi:hypothetical protein